MSELKKETVETNSEKKTTYTSPKVSNALSFDNLCTRRVFPTANGDDSYIEKCVFFENAEKYIEALKKELKYPEIVERQIRIDAQHFIERLLVDTQGKVTLKNAKKDICPIALFHLMARRNMGTSCGVSSCPYGGLKRTDDRAERSAKKLAKEIGEMIELSGLKKKYQSPNDFLDPSVFIPEGSRPDT